MDALDREVATVLVGALRGLVRYVDARTDEYTEDDDVRALEDVADVLHQASPEAQARLREIWGEESAEILGDTACFAGRHYAGNVDEDVSSQVVERLIRALASQVVAPDSRVLAPGAIEAFGGLDRAETRELFGSAGHLVHYGAETEDLELLMELISQVQRQETDVNAALAPGDVVRIVGELPHGLDDYDPSWLSETPFVIRYVGLDATADVQPTLLEDYVMKTIPLENLKRTL